MHATILKGIVGGFEFSFFQRNLKEFARKAIEMCLRVLKESNKSRSDSYSRQVTVLIISHSYPFGIVTCTFFATIFLEIAVCFDGPRDAKVSEGWYGQPKYCYKKQYTLF